MEIVRQSRDLSACLEESSCANYALGVDVKGFCCKNNGQCCQSC